MTVTKLNDRSIISSQLQPGSSHYTHRLLAPSWLLSFFKLNFLEIFRGGNRGSTESVFKRFTACKSRCEFQSADVGNIGSASNRNEVEILKLQL
jgi:hypothetical protein